MKHMRYTSTCFFLDAYVIWMKLFTFSTSQGVGILFPMVTLHTTDLIYIYISANWICVSFQHAYTLGGSWKQLWMLRQNQIHFIGVLKTSFPSLFYVFNLPKHSSFNLYPAMKKFIRFRDESGLATILNLKSISAQLTGILVFLTGNNSMKNNTWQMSSLSAFFCFGSR